MATHYSTLIWRIPGQRSLAGYSSWGCKESDATEYTTHTHNSPIFQVTESTKAIKEQFKTAFSQQLNWMYALRKGAGRGTWIYSLSFWLSDSVTFSWSPVTESRGVITKKPPFLHPPPKSFRDPTSCSFQFCFPYPLRFSTSLISLHPLILLLFTLCSSSEAYFPNYSIFFWIFWANTISRQTIHKTGVFGFWICSKFNELLLCLSYKEVCYLNIGHHPPFSCLLCLKKKKNYYPSMKKRRSLELWKLKLWSGYMWLTNNSKPYLGPWLTAGINRLNHMNPRS